LAGIRLRAFRESLDDLEQKVAASTSGVAQNTWNQWENGKRPADAFAMARFCNHYGCSMDWIYRGNMAAIPAGLRETVALNYQHLLKAAGIALADAG